MCAGNSINFRHTNGCSCESVKVLERKCLDLRGTPTTNLRIHAECSNHLSYQGQTFNTGSGGSAWINFNHCHSHKFVSYDSHQINQCEYEFENANYDVWHTYAINWKWNNWYHFHFYFNYHLMHFQLKTNSVGITEVSVVPMAKNMYFIQWIITSYYPNGYKLYRNNIVCIKIACV